MNNNSGEDTGRKNNMKVYVKSPGRGRGYVELVIKGRVATEEESMCIKKALERFERQKAMKYYLNLGEAKSLCGRTLEDIMLVKKNIEENGLLFDVVDLSEELESSLRDINMFNSFKPGFIGAFKIMSA